MYSHSTADPDYETKKFLRYEKAQSMISFADKIARKPRNLVETNISKRKRDNYGSKGKTLTNKIVLLITCGKNYKYILFTFIILEFLWMCESFFQEIRRNTEQCWERDLSFAGRISRNDQNCSISEIGGKRNIGIFKDFSSEFSWI